MRIVKDRMKIKTVTLYFTDATILWWRRRYSDIERGTYSIESWEDMKQEIKRQFYPENSVAKALAKLRHLIHQGSIKEHVREFSGFPLKLLNMKDEETLFDSVNGLQN